MTVYNPRQKATKLQPSDEALRPCELICFSFFGHRKEIRKLTSRALVLRRRIRSDKEIRSNKRRLYFLEDNSSKLTTKMECQLPSFEFVQNK